MNTQQTTVMKMMDAKEYTCIHEEQIQQQSRKIERIDAELNYKKEKLDDLKKDNERMESKIDDIKTDINKLMLKSKTDDDKLQNRLTIIETRLDTQEKITKDNREDANLKLGIIGTILVVVQIILHFM